MQRFLFHLPWIAAAATAVSCVAALASRDADWMRAAVVFSFATVLLVLRLILGGRLTALQPIPAAADSREPGVTAGRQGFLRRVWPESASGSPTVRLFIYLTWIVAAGAVVLWLGAAVSGGDAEWLLPAVGLSFGAFVLFLATAFPGRFTAWQRLMAGAAVLVGLIVVGLMVFAAAMAGFGAAR